MMIKLCKSIEDLLFMQFTMQGTKVFIKLELRKIHLYFAVFIHSTFVNLSKDDSYVFKYRSAA